MSVSEDDMPERTLSRGATWKANKYYFERVLINERPDAVVLFKNNLTLKTFVVDELTTDELFMLFRYAVSNGCLGALQLRERLAETYADIKDSDHES